MKQKCFLFFSVLSMALIYSPSYAHLETAFKLSISSKSATIWNGCWAGVLPADVAVNKFIESLTEGTYVCASAEVSNPVSTGLTGCNNQIVAVYSLTDCRRL